MLTDRLLTSSLKTAERASEVTAARSTPISSRNQTNITLPRKGNILADP